MKLKIMTYNIASCRTFDGDKPKEGEKFKMPYNPDRCCEVINKIKPDFLGLNEICEGYEKYNGDKQPALIAEKCGFPYSFFGKAISFNWEPNGAYGNAQVSKFPFVSTEVVQIPDPKRDEEMYYEHRCIIKNVIELPDKKRICVMQIHVGLAIGEHQSAYNTLCKLIDETEEPIILMGDFNMREWDFMIEGLRKKLVDVADALGEKFIRTFPSGHNYTNCPDIKIDYIFVSPSIKVLSHGTYQSTASDHLPYFAEIEI